MTIVATTDLDLSQPHDRARLDRRLTRAAREVCGDPSRFNVVGVRKARRCRAAVLSQVAPRRNQLLANAAAPATATLAGR